VHRWQIDPTRHLAQYLCIPLVCLGPSGPNPECPNQGCIDNARLVPQFQCNIRHPKRLGTCLDYYPTLFLLLEELLEPRGIQALLLDNLSVAAAHAYLRFSASKIDCNMVHG